MKLQSLAVIFVIIILPVSLVVSEYIQLQLDSVVLMASYDAKLNDATYDAIRAYQLNEQNATTDGINNEKVRDIEASINSFYASLANSMGAEGYTEEDLKPYVPAIVYTLYDGYYIYGPYRKKSNNTLDFGIKPFIAYSEKYENGDNSIVINYTLDNYITVYGKIDGEYIQKGGFIVDPDMIKVNYNNVKVGELMILNENLTEVTGYDVQNDDETPDQIEKAYKYVNQWSKANEDNNKIHIESRQKIMKNGNKWITSNIDKTYGEYTWIDESIVPQEDKERLTSTNISDESAILYYKSAKSFSEWVKNKLDWVTIPQTNSAEITYSNSNKKLFENLKEIEDEDSIFNSHRKEVIRKSIESNLRAAIESYNSISQSVGILDAFKMPKLTEKDWEKILNNISVISFLQNIITKNNYQKYSGYSVLTNNQNKDYIDPTQIYIYDRYEKIAHRISCKKVINGEIALDNIRAYKNTDFLRQNVFDNQGMLRYYYKHYATLCYDCLVNTQDSQEENLNKTLEKMPQYVKETYYTALAREKYNVNMNWKEYYFDENFEIVVSEFKEGYRIETTDNRYTIKGIYYSKNARDYRYIGGTWINRDMVVDEIFVYAIADKDGNECKSKIIKITNY